MFFLPHHFNYNNDEFSGSDATAAIQCGFFKSHSNLSAATYHFNGLPGTWMNTLDFHHLLRSKSRPVNDHGN